MKKVIISFILVFILVLFGLNNIKAEENNVEIKSIEIQEKSENTISDIEENNELNYNMNLELFDIDDYITYKIIVKNSSNKDYEIGTITDNLESEYIESSYTTNKNELKKGEEVELYLTLKYKNSIATSKEIFNHNLVITLKYTNGETSNISDIVLDDNTVQAGNTGINKNTIIKIICYSVIAVSIILLIVLAILRKKNLKNIGLLLLLVMIPSVFAEDNEERCTININILLHNKRTASFISGIELNVAMRKLAGAPDDLEFVEGRTDNYFYSESENLIDHNNNIISIIHASDEQYNSIKNNLTGKNIVSTENSKYPIYMWFEVTGEYWLKEVNENGNYKRYIAKRGEDGDDGNQEYFDGGIIYWYTDASIVYINEDASNMFYLLYGIEKMDLSDVDTSNIKNVRAMFYQAGFDATTFKVDLSGWDMSNVTNMRYMFESAGANATTFEMDLSGWDVSNVTDMSDMFYMMGFNATTFALDLSNWNVSNVTNMSSMFISAGANATTFKMDLSNWDTSNVTDMSGMFEGAGEDATEWNVIGISAWDVSNVNNMGGMFILVGSNVTTFELDLTNWDVSNVTNMSSMFSSTGTNAITFEMDLSNWDTSNVTNMRDMFAAAGENATTFEVNLSNWNTSSVIDMSEMFRFAGYNATVFGIDLSAWNVSNVTDMSYMFQCAGYNSSTFNLGDLSNWNTSKVTNMRGMFAETGSNASEWDIGSLKIYSADIYSMFNDCSSANTTLNIYNLPTLGWGIFSGAATNPNSRIVINYAPAASGVIDSMIATKSSNSNVVKGSLIQ